MSAVNPDKVDLYQQKHRSILTGFLLGLLSLLPSLAAAVQAHSVLIFADALRSGGETLASLLSLLALRQVRRGSTPHFNYGRGKLENLTSLAVAGAMLISWVIILYSAIERFRHPAAIGNISLALLVTGSACALNLWTWRRNYRLARIENSPIMEAQWRLFRAKTAANVLVLLSLMLSAAFRSQHWAAFVDPIGSLLLSGLLLFSAYRVITGSFFDLLDHRLEESLQFIILAEVAAQLHEIAELHGIRSRRSGSSVYIEIFLEFDGRRPMAEVQTVINRMKEGLEQQIQGSHVTIVPATARVI